MKNYFLLLRGAIQKIFSADSVQTFLHVFCEHYVPAYGMIMDMLKAYKYEGIEGIAILQGRENRLENVIFENDELIDYMADGRGDENRLKI